MPRDIEAPVHDAAGDPVDRVCQRHRGGQAPQKPPEAVDEALVIHHLPEALLPQTHGAQHGELPPPQHHAGGDGVEHVGHGDEGDEDDEAVGEHPHHRHQHPLGLLVGGLIIEASGVHAVGAELLADGLAGPGMVRRRQSERGRVEFEAAAGG